MTADLIAVASQLATQAATRKDRRVELCSDALQYLGRVVGPEATAPAMLGAMAALAEARVSGDRKAGRLIAEAVAALDALAA